MLNYQFTISKKAELMNEQECDAYISELKKRRQYIHDINVTCKMPPFTEDAHGIMMSDSDSKQHIDQMLFVQSKTEIPISLVFNNIYVPNDIPHMNQFIENFAPYYERGIRNLTLPHILWMKTGEIQKRYPDLFIKSTVLRRIRSGQDFWNYATAGFECVNIDRLLYRDMKALQDIRRAQKRFFELTGRYVYISMVIDENCIGCCPFWEEHYQHSMTSEVCKNPTTNAEGFNVAPMYSGCREKDRISLRRVNLIGFREDMESVFENIDIIKIGGRRFRVDTFKLMDSIIEDTLACHPLLHKILVRGNEDEIKLLEIWRKKTRNCGYQCWECDLCDKLDAVILNTRIREWKYSLLK